MQRGRKRGASQNSTRGRNSISNNQSSKRARRSDLPVMQVEPEETREPAEKPDAHLCLKVCFAFFFIIMFSIITPRYLF